MGAVYRSASVVIFHGDCREVVPLLDRASVQLIVTDPPYGVKFQSGLREHSYDQIDGDDGSLDVEECLTLAIGRLKMRRHLYVFGPVDQTKLPVSATTELVWDKAWPGMGNLSSPWAPAHERILFAVARGAKSERESLLGRGNLSARSRKGSVLRARRSHGVKTRHPNEKPVALMRELIESSSVTGEVVLDPFMGSGSTLVAAILLGRKAVGIDTDASYVSTAIGRVKAAEKVVESMAGL